MLISIGLVIDVLSFSAFYYLFLKAFYEISLIIHFVDQEFESWEGLVNFQGHQRMCSQKSIQDPSSMFRDKNKVRIKKPGALEFEN